MNQTVVHNGVAPHSWLLRHVPWLGLFALVASLFRDDGAIGFDPDDLNG